MEKAIEKSIEQKLYEKQKKLEELLESYRRKEKMWEEELENLKRKRMPGIKNEELEDEIEVVGSLLEKTKLTAEALENEITEIKQTLNGLTTEFFKTDSIKL